MSSPKPLSIAIIGAGLSGVACALQLARRLPSASITLCEQSASRVGVGSAYAPPSDFHILNVPAESMGITPDAPGAFYDFLSAHGHTVHGQSVGRSDFVSRRMYGQYLQAILKGLIENGDCPIQVWQDAACRVVRRSPHEFEVQTSGGQTIRANQIIVATGTIPKPLPVEGHARARDERIVMEPWHQSAFEKRDFAGALGIIGSGLSAVDVILEGIATGFTGSFVVISTRGLFPCLHASDLSAVPPLPLAPSWRSCREALRALRTECARRAEWPHAIDAVRPHLNTVWRSFSIKEQRRFFRHASSLWDVHRHRMPRSSGAAIQQLLTNGRLTVIAGRVTRIVVDEEMASVHIQRRGTSVSSPVRVERLINCTGFSSDVAVDQSGLSQSLLAQGLGVPGEHGIGWKCDLDGRLLDAAGTIIPGLWCMGSLRRATEFESTAAREIRAQAARLAEALAGSSTSTLR